MEKGKKELNARDICLILDKCALAGVRGFKCSTFEVDFVGPGLTVPTELPVPRNVQAAQVLREQEAIASDEATLREAEISRLLIEDPVRYEELVHSGDLTEQQSEESSEETSD